MAGVAEAQAAWDAVMAKYLKRTPTRIAFLGDGFGHATSNMIVNANPAYVFAREDLTTKQSFPVINRNAVRPAFDLPVVLGYTEDEPYHEQIISIHWASMEHNPSASAAGGLGPHGGQHAFGGGDEVFIDSRQFTPGLARPTRPPGMSVEIESFIHYYQGWNRFLAVTSKDLSEYIHSTLARFLLICVDPETNALVYRAGPLFAGASWADYYGTSAQNNGFREIPTPAGNEIPICAIAFSPGMTSIDWNAATVDNLFDMRMHLGQPDKYILDRLDQIEGYVGFKPSLMMMGSEDTSSDETNGAAYASIYVVDQHVETAISVAGTAVQYAEFSEVGPSKNINPNPGHNHLHVLKTGVYAIDCHLVMETVSGAGASWEFQLKRNNGAERIGALHAHQDLGSGGNDHITVSMHGILILDKDDTVELWVTNDDNTQNVIIDTASITLHMISES